MKPTVGDAFSIQAQIVRELVGGIRLRLKPEEHRRPRQISTWRDRMRRTSIFEAGSSSFKSIAIECGRPARGSRRQSRSSRITVSPGRSPGALLRAARKLRRSRPAPGAPSRGERPPRARSRRIRRCPKRTSRRRRPRFKFEWNWVGAHASYQPGYRSRTRATAYGRSQSRPFLSAAERHDEALEQARRAEEIDPWSAEVKGTVAMMYDG